MSYNTSVNWQRLEEILRPVELTLDSDIEKLRRIDERKRAEQWNKIEANQNIFENELLSGLPADLRMELGSKFTLGKLLLATAAYVNREESPVIDNFNRKELDLVQDFERYNLFDVLSIEEIVQRIARREDIYELVIDFYQMEYSNLDKLLDDADIQKGLKLAFKNRYKKRLNKVVEGVKSYVGQYGPVLVVTQVEKKIWDKIKESEEDRKHVSDELEKQLSEITASLKPLGDIDEQDERLRRRLSDIEAELAAGNKPQDLGVLKPQIDQILEQYLDVERGLSCQIETVSQRHQELGDRQDELKQLRNKCLEQGQEEKRRLIESEINEIETLQDKLSSQDRSLRAEKTDLEIKRRELESRLKEITDAIEGKPIRFTTKEDARLCELNFIARFDTKMQTFPLKIYSPVDRRSYEIKSWKQGAHLKFAQGGPPQMPANVRSRYSISERKYVFFGDRVEKVVMEAVSLNHLDEFERYGFDIRRANLADFLDIVNRHISSAELGKYLHVLGIASPTGWDDRVRKEIESADFAHNYVSRYVSVCLVDSGTGEVVYNPTDDRISELVEFFQPQFDREKVAKVKKLIMDGLSLKDYVVFSDILEVSNERREIVTKAFYDLTDEGGYRMRHIRDVGVVLEVAPEH
ncbi:MAG: hypothetical protein WBH01_05775 [Dehalococcoidia bacterium]